MNMRICLTLITLLLATHSVQAATPLAEDDHSAVILAYHHIGEDAYPESSLRTEQFQEHIKEIENGNYNVIALPALINALKTGEDLPPKTIAITFEGGFRSAYDNAMPLLLERDIPFTVFFASGMTDRQTYIDWNIIKRLSKNKNVTFGILPHDYSHIAYEPPAEQRRQINKARKDFRDNLGYEASYFSYPYGEISNTLRTIVEEQSFAAAFGLQSGTAYKDQDFLSLARFTLTEPYGSLERFRLVSNAAPLPAYDIEPEDQILDNTNTPAIGFTLPQNLHHELTSLSCFISGQAEKPKLEILGNRVELRPADPISADRIRINCTLPAPMSKDETPRWRWLGMLLHRQEATLQPDAPL